MLKLEIDPDITKASTLSAEFYTDPDHFAASRELIFRRSWQLIADRSEMDSANLVPKIFLPEFVDEPMLLTKAAGDQLRCLSNVCTHRGFCLIDTPSNETGIRCRYHGRRFALDGSFLSMPEFELASGFPSEKDNLRNIPVKDWRRFIFASPDPAFDLKELVENIDHRIPWFDFNVLEFIPERGHEYVVNAHWALYSENYLEGFHVPYVHPGLNKQLDYGSYRTETFRYSSLQIGFAETDENAFRLPSDSPEYGKNVAAYYFFLFPNLMLNFYPWGLSVNIVRPITNSQTKVTYLTYVSDAARMDSGAGSDLGAVELEDQAVVESVQRGIRSRFYDRGRYSPTREQGTHHFHRLIAEFMETNRK